MSETDLTQGPNQVGSGADGIQPGPQASGDYVPDPLLRWILQQVGRAEPKIKDWRKNTAMPGFRFLAGSQLSDEDEAILKSENRPTTAFNTAQKYIRYISGVERDSPAGLMVQAINLDSTPAAAASDYLTKFYNWANRQTKGDSERSRAYEDFLTCGMAFTQSCIDRSRDPRGLISVRRFSPFEALFPDNCDRMNLEGARWLGRESWVEAEEAKSWFDDAHSYFLIDQCARNKEDGGGGPSQNQLWQWPEPPRVPYKIPYVQSYPLSSLETEAPKAGQVKLMEFQWWQNAPKIIYMDPLTQKVETKDEADFKKYERRLQLINIPILDHEREISRSYRKAFVLDRRFILGEPTPLPGPRFTINALCCHFAEHLRTWYGFMSLLIDPQRYKNKAWNQALEALAHATKGGYIAELSAIGEKGDVDQFKKDAAVPGSISIVTDGALKNGAIKEKSNEKVPEAALAIMSHVDSEMDVVTGISAESLGLGASTTAGVTIKRRQRAGIVLLAAEFDALRDFRINEAHIIFDHAEFITDDRMVMVGEDPYDQQVMQLVRDPFTLEYLVQLDEAETNPDVKMMYMEYLLGPLGQTMLRMNMFTPDMLNALPFPRKWIEAIKQSIEQKTKMEQEMRAQGLPIPGQRGPQKTPDERASEILYRRAQSVQKLAQAESLTKKTGLEAVRMLLESLTPQPQMPGGNGGPPQPQNRGIA
ncbi:MAG TPA: hypothetical protein VJW93_01640 [Candidatus Acidoferrales bacterium]|nr:hypothetical protein [Candidatus Acidoferrales bacterium]